jgi:HNH endonuclease
MAYAARPIADRFWEKVEKTDSCWLWKGARKPLGYGTFMVKKGRFAIAHRMSWQFAFGDIPSGLHVLHRCDVPACVRPDHLFLGTQADNMADCIEKGRRRYGYRDQRGDRNPNVVYSDAMVAAMLADLAAGGRPVSVARAHGISYYTLWQIRRHRTPAGG